MLQTEKLQELKLEKYNSRITEKKSEDSIRLAKHKHFLKKKKEATFSGYAMIDKSLVETKTNYLFLPFIIIFILSLFKFIYSFKKRNGIVLLLAIVNFIMLFVFIISSLTTRMLIEISQLKYGFYLLTINIVAITLISDKLLSYPENNK